MKYLTSSLLIAAAAMAHAGTIEAQTVNWVEMGSPSARCCMGMAYDAATQSTVLFGGVGPLGDTWIWRGGWLRASPAASPSARSGAGMAYDGTAGNIVLFGGVDSNGTYLNDTWTWDGTTWTQQFPPVSPPARVFNITNMAYDAATQNVVLFGGSSSGILGDTWTWNGVARTWTQQNPTVSPSARLAPMAYDAATQSVVLFGGIGMGVPGPNCFRHLPRPHARQLRWPTTPTSARSCFSADTPGSGRTP